VHEYSPNYEFVAAQALRDDRAARVLDYGCGTGKLIAHAVKGWPQADFHGVDTFEGIYANWKSKIPDHLSGRIHKLDEGKIPFPDGYFDVVVSNQVFEHVREPLPCLFEINRVLRPGGRFLALFPTRDIWWEGHLGLWLPHRFYGQPKFQRRYIRFMRTLGGGYYKGNLSIEQWTDRMTRVLRDACVYHDWKDVQKWWIEAFGVPPESAALDYMRFRLGVSSTFRTLQPLARLAVARPVLELVCHKRAGRVLEIEKRRD
jgi:SAM-dependent methyltransferase